MHTQYHRFSALDTRLRRLEAAVGKDAPYHIKGTPRARTQPKDMGGFTSYNILSMELSKTDHYRNLDGTAKTLDPTERMRLINEAVNGWMKRGDVICLQEATALYLGIDTNPELHKLLTAHAYDMYFHEYGFQVTKGLTKQQQKEIKPIFTLGLAILVPLDRYIVSAATTLKPWGAGIVPPEQQNAFKKLEREYGKTKNILAELEKNRPTPSDPLFVNGRNALRTLPKRDLDLDLDTLIQLLGEQEAAMQRVYTTEAALVEKAKAKLVEKYEDRSILALALEDSKGSTMLVANLHLPCVYEDKTAMASLAFCAKRAILDWMAQTRLTGFPLLVCGDFNSSPEDTACSCFNGTLDSASKWIDPRISHKAFEQYISNERWDYTPTPLDGCTAYCFSNVAFQAAKAQFEAEMDERYPNFAPYVDGVLRLRQPNECEAYYRDQGKTPPDLEVFKEAFELKKKFFVPKKLWLDHFFLRASPGQIGVVQMTIQTEEEVARRLKGRPIPDLAPATAEPSDHLPIHISIEF